MCQERKDGCGHSQPGQLHTPVPAGKPVKGCSSTVDTCSREEHPSSLGAASPLPRLLQPLRPKVKGERKSVRVSPVQDVNTALLQRLRNVGMAPEHLPSPLNLTLLPAPCVPAQPAPQAGSQELLQAHLPGSRAIKNHLCSCTEDLAFSLCHPAPGRIWPHRSAGHRVHTGVPPAPARSQQSDVLPFFSGRIRHTSFPSLLFKREAFYHC